VIILGIETSCDETSAAVVRDGREILANIVSSQIELHRPYGGVVPELASRQHLALIDSVVTEALQTAGVSWAEVDAVAATYGPGLASSLLIGLNAAKGMALAIGKPFRPVNHMEAHLYSPLLGATGEDLLPMVSLIVSGGHTMLVHATAIGRHRILGQTVDDAAGEAFDKVAKLLGLGYPGGPAVDRLAQRGNPGAIAFPRSMRDEANFNFSFSGLKTSVMYWLRKNPTSEPADVCASFQEAVVDVLVGKTVRAATECGVRTISAAGGVSVNRRLRERLAAQCDRRGWRLLLADASLCTDNAGMIAALAFHQSNPERSASLAVDVAPSAGLVIHS